MSLKNYLCKFGREEFIMSTIDERWNYVKPTKAFCQKVLPLVYDESLSYMEMVCKVTSKLNEIIENNNNLPNYLQNQVKNEINNLINSGYFENIVENIASVGYNFNNVIFLGDSFIEGYGLPNPQEQNWAKEFIKIMPIINYKIYGNGGGGFNTPGANSGYTYNDYVTNVISPDIQNKNEITLFIVQGGLNDALVNYNTQYNNVITFLQNVSATFPNAKIIGLTNVNPDLIGEENLTAVNSAFDTEGWANTKLGYTWLNGRTDLSQDDNKHPSVKGSKYIATKFKQFILNGNDGINWMMPIQLVEGVSGKVSLYVQNGNISIRGAFSTNLLSTQPLTIGTLPGTLYFTIPQRFNALINGNIYTSTLILYGNQIQILFQEIYSRNGRVRSGTYNVTIDGSNKALTIPANTIGIALDSATLPIGTAEINLTTSFPVYNAFVYSDYPNNIPTYPSRKN